MSTTSIRVAVLTGSYLYFVVCIKFVVIHLFSVSDTASTDATYDKSGPTVKDIIAQHPGFECSLFDIVPDDIRQIQDRVILWSRRSDVDWIITTGGTGFGVRDTTPEVCGQRPL